MLYLYRIVHGTKTSKNPASQNIILHNNWVPVCNFIYTKLAEKPMGVAGAGLLPWRQWISHFFFQSACVPFYPGGVIKTWENQINHSYFDLWIWPKSTNSRFFKMMCSRIPGLQLFSCLGLSYDSQSVYGCLREGLKKSQKKFRFIVKNNSGGPLGWFFFILEKSPNDVGLSWGSSCIHRPLSEDLH